MSFNSTNWSINEEVVGNDSLNNDRITVQLHGIDSMLSMDDSILQSIEKESIDRHDCFEVVRESISGKDLTNIMDTDEEIPDNVYVSESLTDLEGGMWEDNTFLNEAFTQINSGGNEENIVEFDDQANTGFNDLVDQKNICTNMISLSEACIAKINPDVYNKDQLTDISILRSLSFKEEIVDDVKLNQLAEHAGASSESCNLSNNKSVFLNSFEPHKRLSTDTSQARNETMNIGKQTNVNINKNEENIDSFYGLPSVVKQMIQHTKRIQSLYEWQDECLRLEAVRKRKNLIYALPTSGGKTLVAEILMLREILCNRKNAIFILPFVALVQEKVHSMAPFALNLGFLVEEYAAMKGQYPPRRRRNKNCVYICTIEKSLGLINSLIENKRFHEIGIIVVDELHLLGESGGRGATLEGLLTKVMCTDANVHIVGMSATIGNLNEIAQFLNADLYSQNFRPIEIKEYVKCDDEIWLINKAEDELLTDMKKINYRYSDNVARADPDKIGGLVMDVIPTDSCLIFCATRKNCENVAVLLTRVLHRSLQEHKKDEKQKLLNILKTEEGLCPILSKTIPFGVAYHHSGLTSEERRLLEDAFREGVLCVICCTSTLAAGVNLPARRVILRSPYIAQEFINLSRYKQMIGRAGRAGMGNIGESILICKRSDLLMVKEMLVSKMDESLSSVHIQKDRGIYNLILSALMLSMATTRFELHSLMRKTLLNIQQTRLGVNLKQVTDSAISSLLKCGAIKVKKNKLFYEMKPNITIDIWSQNLNRTEETTTSRQRRTVFLTGKTELELCSLGRAAMKGPIDLQTAFTLYEDLSIAQHHLILVDSLHILYLVTPYDIAAQVEPNGAIYCDVITRLSENQMKTARLLGINEATASNLRNGIMPKKIEGRVLRRFYVTLILHELCNHRTIYAIADKYQVNRGIVQNLLASVSTFASCVVRFCEELTEFWAFKELLSVFTVKLSYCCPFELEKLLELPSVKIGRARQLYKAGFTTLMSIAKADPTDLHEKIKYLSKKSVGQLIAAAKLLIIEKVENLRDEAADVLEGLEEAQYKEYRIYFNLAT